MIRITCTIALTALIASSAPSARAAEDAGPIHAWAFTVDRVEGKTVRALVGLDGRLHGRARVHVGPAPGGLRLDGVDGSMVLSEQSNLLDLPTAAVSAEAWVRVDQALTWGGIVGVIRDNGSNEAGWLLGYSDQSFSFALATQDKRALTYLTASKPFVLGAWHHVVGTYDGKEHRLYVNGELAASEAVRKGRITYPEEGTFFEVGAYHDSDEYYPMRGMIHSAAVYDRALNGSEIRSRYEALKDTFPAVAEVASAAQPDLGPYAQFDTPMSVVIRWRTAEPSPSSVRFGAPGNLDEVFGDGQMRKAHEVRITGLLPNHKYEYQIALHEDGREVEARVHGLDMAFNYAVTPVSRGPSPYGEYAAPDAQRILETSGARKGYALLLGVADEGALAYELARQSDLIVTCIDTDAARVNTLRRRLYEAGVYGTRVTARQVASYEALPFTGHFANLIVVGDTRADAKEAYRVLRPAGGVMVVGQWSEKAAAQVGRASRPPAGGTPAPLSGNELSRWLTDGGAGTVRVMDWDQPVAMARRPALPGAGVWTHQYGLPDNAANSGDELGGARGTDQLMVQWLGRPGADAMTDRNPRMPAPLAVNGRVFSQGLLRMIAQDAYNGAILWSLETPDFQRVNMPRDAGNWCADEDYIYAAVLDRCWKIEASTGRLVAAFDVADEQREHDYEWGYLARAEGMLYGSGVRTGSQYTNIFGGANEAWADAKAGPITYKVCSDYLFAADPVTGKRLWQRDKGVILNASITIGDGRVYFAENRHKTIQGVKERQLGSPELWQELYLVALDAKTGALLWEQPLDDIAPGTVVFYLQHTGNRVVILSSHESYNLYAFDARDGEPAWRAEHPWPSDHHGGHMQHPAIVAGMVYARPVGYDLETGKPVLDKVPLGGCGVFSAAAGALIFRDSNINMWDVVTQRKTDWPRLRPGCWLSTVAADGMVLSPEGGGGCSCAGWFETSLGFIAREQ